MLDVVHAVLLPGATRRTTGAEKSTERYLELDAVYVFVYAEFPAVSFAQP
jgi:hypothetical protein